MSEKNKTNFIQNLFGKKTKEEESPDVGIQNGVDEKIRLITDHVEGQHNNVYSTYYTNHKLTNEQILSMRDKFVVEAKETWKESSKKDFELSAYRHGSNTVDIEIEKIANKAIDKCLEKQGKTREGGYSYSSSDFSQFVEQEVSDYINGEKENNDFEKDLRQNVNSVGMNKEIISSKESEKQISDDDLIV